MAASSTCSTEMYSSLSLLRLVLGRGQQAIEACVTKTSLRSAGRPETFGRRSSSASRRARQRLHADAGFGQDGWREAAFLFQQGRQQVLDIDLLVPVADRLGLRRPDRLLELFGEAIDVHGFKVTQALACQASGARRVCSLRYDVEYREQSADRLMPDRLTG